MSDLVTKMTARPVQFEVSLETDDARGFLRRIESAYAARVDGDGVPIHIINAQEDGFTVSDHRIRAVRFHGGFESGFGTITFFVQETSGPGAIQHVAKRLAKLGIEAVEVS